MRSTKKKTNTRSKAAGNTPIEVDPEKSFASLVETYQMSDPEQIKLKIMWRYIQAIFLRTNGFSANHIATVETMGYHANHFRLCEMIIDWRQTKQPKGK